MIIGKVYDYEINIDDFGKINYFKIKVKSIIPYTFEFYDEEQYEQYVMFRNLNDMMSNVQYCLIDEQTNKFVEFIPFNLIDNLMNTVKELKIYLDYTIRGNQFDYTISDINYQKIDTYPYRYNQIVDELNYLENRIQEYKNKINEYINILNEYIQGDRTYFFKVQKIVYNTIKKNTCSYESRYYVTR